MSFTTDLIEKLNEVSCNSCNDGRYDDGTVINDAIDLIEVQARLLKDLTAQVASFKLKGE